MAGRKSTAPEITRRDFLNGVALGVAAGLAPRELLAARRYPPALTGLRGNHPGSFEAAHQLAWNHVRPARPAEQTDATYDLVIVGGGLSGLAAALLYQQRHGGRVLVLDNHDDFGGHAKRNEFHQAGEMRLALGGVHNLEYPKFSARANAMLDRLGIENVGPIFTRGVLIDMAAYKGVDRLPVGEVITVEDLEGALEMQQTQIGEGDVVLIHTGHGQLWMVDNDEYSRGGPGIGMAAARWLAEQKIVMTAADTSAVEVIPSENPNHAYPVHQELLVRHGIYNLENLDLSELAADKVYEFAFIFSPVKFKGATGSPGNPIAVR